MITRQNADPLDAVIAGVNIQELDPEDQSVGLGGLPNEEGVVQLDASCMHGPTKRAGAVGALEGIATPSLVAKAVMDYTDHIFLVGAGAKKFALEMGFKEQELLTDESRRMWLRWKAGLNPFDNWLDWQSDTARISARDAGEGSVEKLHYDWRGIAYTYGTINMNAVDAKGDIGSVTTTSGLSWKLPGRVGDSPIIGAGQYCDNAVGAAGSTGRGESNIKVCGAFLAVEFMRQGMAPEQALTRVMERVLAMTEKRLLDDRGRPYFDLSYYAVSKDGRFAGATAYEGGQFAVCDAQGARLVDSAFLFKKSEKPTRPFSGAMPPGTRR
jgi:N4-(beta-N-acetylglucosaminyl)-L-asparaginase